MTRVRDKFSLLTSDKGFTLIELLIVIVIIGILAGVLIAVIDPAAQQNRARDATVESTINKIALAVGGFRSAYGRPPDTLEFLGSIDGETAVLGCDGTDVYCHFSHTTSLPDAASDAACEGSPNDYYGNGTTSAADCNWRYEINGNEFYIYGKSFGINNGVFIYDSTDSEIHQCSDSDLTPPCP
jgi:prepilin-type N-terminal cleavage/methylation domain-containing protein